MSVVTVDKISCWLISTWELQWLNKFIAENLIYFQLNKNKKKKRNYYFDANKILAQALNSFKGKYYGDKR